MQNPPIPFRRPLEQRTFEDYQVGLEYSCGPVAVEIEECLAFAKRFDPQWIHTDREMAETGPFGGLIASGWHTASLAMRLMVLHYLNQDASLGGIGVDDLRWPSPVRPGDSLSVRFRVTEARLSRRGGRGIVTTEVSARNQQGDVVLTMTAISLVRTRT